MMGIGGEGLAGSLLQAPVVLAPSPGAYNILSVGYFGGAPKHVKLQQLTQNHDQRSDYHERQWEANTGLALLCKCRSVYVFFLGKMNEIMLSKNMLYSHLYDFPGINIDSSTSEKFLVL